MPWQVDTWQDDICIWQYDTDTMTWHDDTRWDEDREGGEGGRGWGDTWKHEYIYIQWEYDTEWIMIMIWIMNTINERIENRIIYKIVD